MRTTTRTRTTRTRKGVPPRIPITRTAPGWEERTLRLARPVARRGAGTGAIVTLPPGFARLALLLDVRYVDLPGLRVWVQHSPGGDCWHDLAAFEGVDGPDAQVAWVEAQPAVAGAVGPVPDGSLPPGSVHGGFCFPRLRARWSAPAGRSHLLGVELVAIYPGR